MLYREKNGKLVEIPEDGFPVEKDLQAFVEKNIETLLNLKFIATEFYADDHNRIDTLAFDPETNAFVIIEDKNVRNISLVDQGYAYLAAVLDRKEKLVLRYNLVMNEKRSEKDFDWTQTHIIFISPVFTDRQIQASSFMDMPFELYELRKFGDSYSWRNVTLKVKFNAPKPKHAKEDTSEKKILQEIRVYTEDDILPEDHPCYPQYLILRDNIADLPDVDLAVMKTGIKFRINGKRFGEVDKLGVTKNKFDILVSDWGALKDPTGLLRDISSRKWGNSKYRIQVEKDTDMNAVAYLLEQTYNNAKRTMDKGLSNRQDIPLATIHCLRPSEDSSPMPAYPGIWMGSFSSRTGTLSPPSSSS